MYMQRYIERFPSGGEVVIFDRSWYNRAGVEYVMGFCTPEQHQRFLLLCPIVEKFVVDGGIHLIKIWLEWGRRNKSGGSAPGSTIRSGNGSSVRWTSNRSGAGMTTPGREISCSNTPTQSTRFVHQCRDLGQPPPVDCHGQRPAGRQQTSLFARSTTGSSRARSRRSSTVSSSMPAVECDDGRRCCQGRVCRAQDRGRSIALAAYHLTAEGKGISLSWSRCRYRRARLLHLGRVRSRGKPF